MRPGIGFPRGSRRLCSAAVGGHWRWPLRLLSSGRDVVVATMALSIPSSAAFGEIGEGCAKASRFAEAHSELVLAERPRVGQTQVRETDSMTLDRPPVASLIAVQRSTKISLIVAL